MVGRGDARDGGGRESLRAGREDTSIEYEYEYEYDYD
jgi:hypothetical protein